MPTTTGASAVVRPAEGRGTEIAMKEHCIRLRGGWVGTNRDDPDASSFQIALPAHFDHNAIRRLRLSRRFQRPPLDHATEALWLRLGQVPGLLSATLNDAPLLLVPHASDLIEIPLSDLPPRNLLVLDVDLPAQSDVEPARPSPWGEVALVIRSTAP